MSAFETFRPLVRAIAARYGYDPAELAAQAHSESGWNPRALSHAGAQGLMQFMPGTWTAWGRGLDPFDPEASLDAGVRYMVWLRAQFPAGTYADPLALAWASYNWGIGRVQGLVKRLRRTDWDGLKSHMPEETQAYVERCRKRVGLYQGLFGALGQVAQVAQTATHPLTALVLLVALGAGFLLRKVFG